jgi:DNA polymerase III epsilon subunit-like protein
MKKRPAMFDLVLALDSETSGIAMGSLDPTYRSDPGVGAERYQAVSFGLIVADVHTLKPIDSLYVEIKHDDNYYNWSDGAERVHGLSREYLEANGMSLVDAATKILNFIEKYFGPYQAIRKLPMLGHNVATFDRYFLHDLLSHIDVEIQFGNRHIDTFSLGVVLMDLFSSDELFDFFELKRDAEKHNALDDAKYALKVARLMKKNFQA